MKNILFLALLISLRGLGQTNFNDSLAVNRNTLSRNYMEVLGGFAVANIAAGFAVASKAHGQSFYFWRMNAYWNVVNLGIATMGYLGAQRALTRKYSLAQNDKAQLSVEKTYVLNFGLDLFYVAAGFYMIERGNNEPYANSYNQFRGYGSSVAVQGGCLAVMDAVMIMLHHRNSVRLNRHLEKLEAHMAPGAVALVYNL